MYEEKANMRSKRESEVEVELKLRIITFKLTYVTKGGGMIVDMRLDEHSSSHDGRFRLLSPPVATPPPSTEEA